MVYDSETNLDSLSFPKFDGFIILEAIVDLGFVRAHK